MSDARATRHSSTTMALARTMYGDGDSWTIAQIARYLKQDHPTLNANTVQCWVDPKFAERRRQSSRDCYNRARNRQVAAVTGQGRWERLTTLREFGLSYHAIAIVLHVDYDLDVTGEWVRAWFRRGPNAYFLAVLAGNRPVQKKRTRAVVAAGSVDTEEKTR